MPAARRPSCAFIHSRTAAIARELNETDSEAHFRSAASLSLANRKRLAISRAQSRAEFDGVREDPFAARGRTDPPEFEPEPKPKTESESVRAGCVA